MCSVGGDAALIEVTLTSHSGMRARRSHCRLAAPGYDRLRSVTGVLYRCGGYRSPSVTRLDGWSVSSMGSWLSISRGVTASGR
jgi:hypothetical protein